MKVNDCVVTKKALRNHLSEVLKEIMFKQGLRELLASSRSIAKKLHSPSFNMLVDRRI